MGVSLNRIIVFGKEIARLKRFYMENLGLSLVEEIENQWVVLKAGGMEIALHKIGAQYDSKNTLRADSNTKLVFEIDEDLQAFRTRLLNNAVVLKSIWSPDGGDALYCDAEDPEGNVFQLKQLKTIL